MVINITVPENIRNLAQKFDIEKNSRKDIIVYILSNKDINISKERFDEYQKEYEEKYFAFEQIKKEIEKNYVFPAIKDISSYISWSLDYDTSTITIEVDTNE